MAHLIKLVVIAFVSLFLGGMCLLGASQFVGSTNFSGAAVWLPLIVAPALFAVVLSRVPAEYPLWVRASVVILGTAALSIVFYLLFIGFGIGMVSMAHDAAAKTR